MEATVSKKIKNIFSNVFNCKPSQIGLKSNSKLGYISLGFKTESVDIYKNDVYNGVYNTFIKQRIMETNLLSNLLGLKVVFVQSGNYAIVLDSNKKGAKELIEFNEKLNTNN